jgi:hypothetical protein
VGALPAGKATRVRTGALGGGTAVNADHDHARAVGAALEGQIRGGGPVLLTIGRNRVHQISRANRLEQMLQRSVSAPVPSG